MENPQKCMKNPQKCILTVAEGAALKMFFGQKEHNKTVRNSTIFFRVWT